MTGRAIVTLGLTIALSTLLCAQQVPPPPPPTPPPEGAPITPALSRLLASHDEPERIATGLGSLAGIVWTKVGTLFVAEVTQNIIIEWSPIAGRTRFEDRAAARWVWPWTAREECSRRSGPRAA